MSKNRAILIGITSSRRGNHTIIQSDHLLQHPHFSPSASQSNEFSFLVSFTVDAAATRTRSRLSVGLDSAGRYIICAISGHSGRAWPHHSSQE